MQLCEIMVIIVIQTTAFIKSCTCNLSFYLLTMSLMAMNIPLRTNINGYQSFGCVIYSCPFISKIVLFP